MIRTQSWILLARCILAGATTSAPCAQVLSAPSPEQAIELSEQDLTEITLDMTMRYPLVSSSPGIKFASARRGIRSTDIADVIYFPHTESAGLKQAFQARCERAADGGAWECRDVEIRRYLKLETQQFEVRVTGSISTRSAIAAIESSRALARAHSDSDGCICETAIQLTPDGDGSYLVTWGTSDGYGTGQLVRVRLKGGADPTQPESWQSKEFEP